MRCANCLQVLVEFGEYYYCATPNCPSYKKKIMKEYEYLLRR